MRVPNCVFAITYIRHFFAMSLKLLGEGIPLGRSHAGAMGTQKWRGAGKDQSEGNA